MRKWYFLLVGLVMFSMKGQAQIELTLKQKKMLKDLIEERVPALINGKQEQIKLLHLDKINVGAKSTKIKASFAVEVFEQELFKDPLAFKTKLDYENGKPRVKYIKVHQSGDRFLFFDRYKKIYPFKK